MIKNISLITLLGALFFFTACQPEYDEENFNFNNSSAQYVDLASGSVGAAIDTTMMGGEVVAVVNDTTFISLSEVAESVTITPRIRVARTSDVNVDVSVTGDITGSFSAVIPAESFTTSISIPVPFATILNGSATATISSVDNGLAIGRTSGDGSDSPDVVSAAISWAAE